jgi:hypothetical protein
MICCTIGVMAYNEEQTIVQVLHTVLAAKLHVCEILEILVMAGGCTDQTVDRAQSVARDHPLITVDEQPVREGKAAAINRLIRLARGEVIVLVGADTLPDPTAIEQLVRPFEDATEGMTGARVVPLNDPQAFMGFTIQMLWHVHHRLALRWPKLGELVAFRNIIPAVPQNAATDEVALEALISGQGYRLVYVPTAVVYNYGPETLGDFLEQRRRIFAGHLHIAATQGYIAASMPLRRLLRLSLESAQRHPSLLPRMFGAAAMECWGRALGMFDTQFGRPHHIWRQVRSTKRIGRFGGSKLLARQLRAGGVRPAHLLRRRADIPDELGILFWWDSLSHEVMFLLLDDHLTDVSLARRAKELAQYIGGSKKPTVLAYRLVDFQPACPLPGRPNDRTAYSGEADQASLSRAQ